MIENPSEKDEIYLANVAKIGASIDNIRCLENVLSPKEHKVLLEYVKNTDSWVKQPWLVWTITPGFFPKNILEILKKIFNEVWKKSTDFYDVKIDPFSDSGLSILKFEEGFHLTVHVDTASAELNHIASIYYINDDYEGGEINFPDYNLKIKPKANSLLFFPGNEDYEHEVTKILSGDRYSSSVWFQFTGSTFNKKSEWYG